MKNMEKSHFMRIQKFSKGGNDECNIKAWQDKEVEKICRTYDATLKGLPKVEREPTCDGGVIVTLIVEIR